ncbi:MAG: hypothetical protein K5829_13035 [Treponema sp.]|nr:hypothetical protein [Treponema sp.]
MNLRTLPQKKSTSIRTENDLHLYEFRKILFSKDDVGALNRGLRHLSFKVSGKKAFDKDGNHVGFKCSAKCRPKIAEGHNRRDNNWVEKLEHVAKFGDYEIWMDYKNLDTVYKDIFGEALEEYNESQRSNRRIKNYLSHIQNDKRQGSMKKSAKIDNSRKPYYEFIFQIGRRDNRLDTESSKKILKEFCLEWMPEHYPNIHPIGIYLHADESTKDAVTGERLQGAVHVHFVYVPIAHALSKEEQKEEKIWKKELEETARKIAESKGEVFDKTKFDAQDWQLLRANKFGKAIGNGMKLQTSLTGACCEMGFRTKGKLTAQIQMEEAVRQDLLDLVESYGIKVDRTIDTERDQVVTIQEYKKREDNKAILAANKKLEEKIMQDKLKNIEDEKENKEKAEELVKREAVVAGLENEKKSIELKASELQKEKEKVEPYLERIDTLVEDELIIQRRLRELNEQAAIQRQKEKNFKEKTEAEKEEMKFRLEKIEEKEAELKKKEAVLIEQEKIIDIKRSQNEELSKLNSENAERNEKNAKELEEKYEDFATKEKLYKKYRSTVKENEMINIHISGIGRNLKSELLNDCGSWNDKVDYAVSNFTDLCQQVITKLNNAIVNFKTFLQGKTPQDFRNLANDMDRNGTRTFEEYASKRAEESLDWQIEQRRQKLQLKARRRTMDIER